MPQKWVIAPYGDPTNEPPWGSTLKIETGAENIMPTPLTGGQEISFAPQMIFLGLRPGGWAKNDDVVDNSEDVDVVDDGSVDYALMQAGPSPLPDLCNQA